MADEMSMALAELLGKINLEPDFLREGVRLLAQALMALDPPRYAAPGWGRNGGAALHVR
jgi:hypothetical protein